VMNRRQIQFIVTFLLVLVALPSCFSCSSEEADPIRKTFANPLFDGADPWFVQHEGFYYYCYTANNSIYVRKSELLTKPGEAFIVWRAPSEGWNRACVWAPELHFYEGHWYIYYAAGESGPPFIHQKTGVLMSETADAQGNYIDKGMIYTGDNVDLVSDNVWAIDMNLFEFNGKLYTTWSGWVKPADTDKTSQHLYIAEMVNPYTMKGPRVKLASPEEPWETGGPLDLIEGSAALQRGDDLFIVYSCRESWTVDYRLGLLKLKDKNGSLLDVNNWEKRGPVFTGPMGVGHCSFVKSPDGKEDWIAYHAKKSTREGWQRDVRLQPFGWKADGYPDFGKYIEPGVEIPRPSGEYKIEQRIARKKK
jgi:GH43 family beta-xylosidase